MIFVTVGTQLPFDRLIGAVDQWAADRPGLEVFAQSGRTGLTPRHIRHRPYTSPVECRERMRRADGIVAHAGMGTILTALELGKPLLVMPRRAALGEHRNDHQLATARRLADTGRVSVAFDEHELPAKLHDLERVGSTTPISPFAPEPFVSALRAFIEGTGIVAA